MKMANTLLPAPVPIAGDDSFEDGCSICLEPFNSINPPTVTKCKHEYHFQCILEWSQRSNECPICSQHLVLKDPASQELLAGVQSDRKLRLRHTFHSVNQDIDVTNDSHEEDDPDFEQRIMTHFTTVANRARDISRRRRLITPVDGNSEVHPSVPVTTTNVSNVTDVNSFSEVHQNLASCFSYIDSATVGASTFTQRSSSSVFPSFGNTPACTSENTQYSVKSSHLPLDNPGRSSSSEFVAFSESLKSKISNASTRYKESISKSTRGLKEKLIARNDSVKEISREVQREMSAGIAGIARMIERLDLTQKRAGVSATLSNYTTGTSKSPHLGKRDDTNIQSLEQNTEGTAYDKGLDPTPFIANGTSGSVEVSLAKDKNL